ncbi:hypothetical protein [Photobacterium profundum]|uniref:Hypothetical secretion protein n=1 Tax=Photobacterium profundum (strain SS9) TaxID=298386 RepID=Q6LVJ2_PHOPR|nr:hypothetical protein [Photobacterium profundum]CAG18683.1 hypothetical secretion protein [Photobacterium profundum SS9]
MFRKEVHEAEKQKLFGSVILIQPVSIYAICASLFITFVIILIFLSQANYSRKESVKGYLLPKSGVVKVFSNRIGVIENLYVKEGTLIQQGDALLKIKNSQSLATGIELSTALSSELSKQIKSLETEYVATTDLNQEDIARMSNQYKQLKMSLSAISIGIYTD